MSKDQTTQGEWGGLPPVLPEPAELVRRAHAEGYGFAREGTFYDPETRCGDAAGIAALLAGCPRDEFGYIRPDHVIEGLDNDHPLFIGIIVGFDGDEYHLDHEPDDGFDLGVAYGRAVARAAGLPAIHHPDAD